MAHLKTVTTQKLKFSETGKNIKISYCMKTESETSNIILHSKLSKVELIIFKMSQVWTHVIRHQKI